MSRIGNAPVKIPNGVSVTVKDGNVEVSGPKGTLTQFMQEGISIAVADGVANVSRVNDEKQTRAKHGLMRSLLNNMVQGVSEGFSKELEIVGVGFKVNLAGKNLKLSLGYSHDVNFEIPEGIDVKIDTLNLTISGIDKQQVGQVAAEIRALRKPEPYKGKGIKYVDEYIIRKAGKAAAGAEA